MKRILRTSASGLFAASLAILPLSAFAQSGSTQAAKPHSNVPAASQSSGKDAKAGTTVMAPAKDGMKTDGTKADSAKSSAATPNGSKVTTAPTAPATQGAKTGG